MFHAQSYTFCREMCPEDHVKPAISKPTTCFPEIIKFFRVLVPRMKAIRLCEMDIIWQLMAMAVVIPKYFMAKDKSMRTSLAPCTDRLLYTLCGIYDGKIKLLCISQFTSSLLDYKKTVILACKTWELLVSCCLHRLVCLELMAAAAVSPHRPPGPSLSSCKLAHLFCQPLSCLVAVGMNSLDAKCSLAGILHIRVDNLSIRC